MVIFVAFNLSLMKGAVTSIILGFFMDFFTGTATGLFVLSYVLIFVFSRFVSQRFYAERPSFIMIFVGLCVFFEGVLIMAIYDLVYGVGKFYHLLDVYLPQALITGMLGPLLFKMFHRIGILHNERITR
jgi:rod shape-determining protein MreD